MSTQREVKVVFSFIDKGTKDLLKSLSSINKGFSEITGTITNNINIINNCLQQYIYANNNETNYIKYINLF